MNQALSIDFVSRPATAARTWRETLLAVALGILLVWAEQPID